MKALGNWGLRSLKSRLLLASFVLLPCILGIAGATLQEHFKGSLESSLAERLKLEVYVLLGVADLANGRLKMPSSGQQASIDHVDSNLAGLIHDGRGRLVWQSASASQVSQSVKDRIARTQVETGEFDFGQDAKSKRYLMHYRVVWQREGSDYHYQITVLESQSNTAKEIGRYQTRLWGWLAAVLLASLLMYTIVTIWGLKPLDRLVADLQSVDLGEHDRLGGNYPAEMQGVAESLNNLLHSEKTQRERYRNTLGDLAHSLKTPLAVVHGAARENLDYQGYRDVVQEQVRRMDQIVQYQLTRAVKGNVDQPLDNVVAISPIVERILSALSKVYRDKDIQLHLALDPMVVFGADERDLMEMLGNLLENAFKYGRSEVAVTLSNDAQSVYIAIEDDGKGVSHDMRQVILERGERADTSAAPGQGIGLSVAVDILSTYNGSLEVGDSASLGGAKFSVTLPI